MNVLRAPGINMKEKVVLQQRIANMTAAQKGYVEKQKKVLGTGWACKLDNISPMP